MAYDGAKNQPFRFVCLPSLKLTVRTCQEMENHFDDAKWRHDMMNPMRLYRSIEGNQPKLSLNQQNPSWTFRCSHLSRKTQFQHEVVVYPNLFWWPNSPIFTATLVSLLYFLPSLPLNFGSPQIFSLQKITETTKNSRKLREWDYAEGHSI